MLNPLHKTHDSETLSCVDEFPPPIRLWYAHRVSRHGDGGGGWVSKGGRCNEDANSTLWYSRWRTAVALAPLVLCPRISAWRQRSKTTRKTMGAPIGPDTVHRRRNLRKAADNGCST
eukprot:69086-Prymnesium_polylepis.1